MSREDQTRRRPARTRQSASRWARLALSVVPGRLLRTLSRGPPADRWGAKEALAFVGSGTQPLLTFLTLKSKHTLLPSDKRGY